MIPRRAAAIVFVLALVLPLLAPRPALAKAEKAKYFWKVATLAPDGVGWAKRIKEMVFPEIERETGGLVKVKVYWGGVMGDDEDYIKKMRIGQLDGAGLSGQGVTIAAPELSVLELPFMFNSWDEVDHVKSVMGKTFDALMAKHGFFLVSWVDQDFDQIYSTKYPMTKLEDFRRAKMLTWYGPVEEATLKALGASPIPVNVPELAATIRSGAADTAIGPAIWVVGAQMYQVNRYVNVMKIRYSPAMIIVTLKSWNAYPELEPFRKRFFELREADTRKYCAVIRQDNARFLAAMQKYGLQAVSPEPKDLAEIKERTHKVWAELTGKLYPKELLDELVGCLAQYRRSKGA